MPETPTSLLHIALNSEVGITVLTEDPERFRQALYRARSADPDLERLSILTSPDNPGGELWIILKEPPDVSE